MNMDEVKSHVLGALARGFCTKENEHKQMDSTLCEAQLGEVMKLDIFASPPNMLRAAFKADPDYAHTWHCNIAMLLQDEGVEHTKANDRVRGFMKLAFDITDYEPKKEK